MRTSLLTMIIAGAGLVGCSTATPQATSQLEYDLTIDADRAQWRAEGLEYEGSVGPYAVYRVTGETQRFTGPRVRLGGGTAMLQLAKNYFVVGARGAGQVTLSLETGGKSVVRATQPPTEEGQCTGPSTQTGGMPAAATTTTDQPSAADAGTGKWGSGCASGSGSSSGAGGWGSGSGSGYGSGSGSGSGYGSGSGSGSGSGYGGGGGGGGSYSNPGGYGGGGWKNSGCGDMGAGGGQHSGGGSDGGVSTSGGGSGGSGSVPGGNSGPSDSEGGTDTGATFTSPAPVGATVLLRKISLGGVEVRADDQAPVICCSKGVCSLASGAPIQ